MKKILLSVLSIAVVAGVVIGASSAFFSDTETSVGNKFTAGTIDISVAGQNPWNTTYPMLLDKPCETNYVNFTIRNVGENPANVWKRIMNVQTDGGDTSFCDVASSEPEYVEGGGQFDSDGNCMGSDYVEQNNLAAYMIYDMYICHGVVNQGDCLVDSNDPATGKPTGTGWTPIIQEDNQVRIDNVNGVWIKLDDALAEGGALAVSQSYHLMAWDDAGVETITNWAQGDVMTFDVELEARQLSAPAPGSENETASLILRSKDGETWEPNGAIGTLTYKTASDKFEYSFSASGLNTGTSYDLIYYADGWPGNHPGALIGTYNTGSGNSISVSNQSKDLGMDLPNSADANYPAGAKIWLVLSSDYDGTKMIGWNPAEYLFEMNLITYDDTNVTP